jgi:hypothetical protein
MNRADSGQAAVEFVALLLLCCVAFGALFAAAGGFDGRSFGGFLARHVVCAAGGRCDRDEGKLVEAYGTRDAATVRALAPSLVYESGERQLPVDWRECRRVECATAPDDPDLDAHLATAPSRATAFTHVIRRGGRLYIQYWLYYPDSPSTFMHSHGILKTLGIKDPAFHPDDWEAFTVRIDAAGRIAVRASAHGHWQWCKHMWCKNQWGPGSGWTRVSRGSHAGHIPMRMRPHVVGVHYDPVWPGGGLHERATTAPGIRLVPLETLDQRSYRPRKGGIKPPWTKQVYGNPTGDTS